MDCLSQTLEKGAMEYVKKHGTPISLSELEWEDIPSDKAVAFCRTSAISQSAVRVVLVFKEKALENQKKEKADLGIFLVSRNLFTRENKPKPLARIRIKKPRPTKRRIFKNFCIIF